MNDNKEKLFALLEKLEVLKKLKPEDKELTGKPLMKRVMQVRACGRLQGPRRSAGRLEGGAELGVAGALRCTRQLSRAHPLSTWMLARPRPLPSPDLAHPPHHPPRSRGCPPPRRCWR